MGLGRDHRDHRHARGVRDRRVCDGQQRPAQL